MNDLIAIAAVTLVAFASTNLDSLLVLVPLLADSRGRAVHVIGGYWLALVGVLSVCWIGARVADEFVPTRFVGLLGVLPIIFGAVGLANLLRNPAKDGRPDFRTAPGMFSTAVLIASMSADNLGVFLALFADKPAQFDAAIGLSTAVAAIALTAIAAALARAAWLRSPLERWGPRIVPVLMILVGLHILLDTTSDVT